MRLQYNAGHGAPDVPNRHTADGCRGTRRFHRVTGQRQGKPARMWAFTRAKAPQPCGPMSNDAERGDEELGWTTRTLELEPSSAEVVHPSIESRSTDLQELGGEPAIALGLAKRHPQLTELGVLKTGQLAVRQRPIEPQR